MDDDLQAIEQWGAALLARMTRSERRAALLEIGRELRRSQQARIAGQQNPDGSAYAPRKARAALNKGARDKAGRIKREAMFRKLRTARFLKVEVTDEGLAVGFSGRGAYVARVHQEGRTERVARDGPEYTYPERKLLGFTKAEREMIRDRMVTHLVK
ncbi:phage virion morphogenesis protein [Cupriavidus sp. UGS-1]|uniref:phage virion morphogenesis protein n=1 Tax=Cupriavidus sp. UGS-1 TaxID=2899826 RepID=UPI001E32043C|nr:phage virion morphogenesis protein [Cupriavidus sp. UGS-1]MCD9124032.1 phage virion morphogenesis protein [Cupriavidus sp. UGS-1]